MLNWIITWSLRNRFLVILGSLLFAGLGAMALRHLDIDAFPDTTPAQVQINTTASALSPEEVERQITFPVEQALGGLPRLENLRSISKFGLSQVVATFADGTDIYFARQVIAERLGTVDLPDGIAKPQMGPIATGLGEVFHYVLWSDKVDLTELRTLQDWVVKPALRTGRHGSAQWSAPEGCDLLPGCRRSLPAGCLNAPLPLSEAPSSASSVWWYKRACKRHGVAGNGPMPGNCSCTTPPDDPCELTA